MQNTIQQLKATRQTLCEILNDNKRPYSDIELTSKEKGQLHTAISRIDQLIEALTDLTTTIL